MQGSWLENSSRLSSSLYPTKSCERAKELRVEVTNLQRSGERCFSSKAFLSLLFNVSVLSPLSFLLHPLHLLHLLQSHQSSEVGSWPSVAPFPYLPTMSRISPVVRSALHRPCRSQLLTSSTPSPLLRQRVQTAYKPIRLLATPMAMPSATKPNIGVYCNPEHKLWVEESGPSVEEVKSGQALKEGEVTIAIKSTGICGCVYPSVALDCCSLRKTEKVACASNAG